VFLLNGDHYGVAYLDRYQSREMAVTGHTDKELCWTELANVVTAERALGKISDLTA
jgi:glucuronate isomerase